MSKFNRRNQKPAKTIETLELKVAPPPPDNEPDIAVTAQPLGGPTRQDLEREAQDTYIADTDVGEVEVLHERRDGDDATTEIVKRDEELEPASEPEAPATRP